MNRRMMGRLGCVALVTICALVSPGSGARAQTATAAPSAAPTPVAFTAHAHADVTVVAQSGTYTGSARLALAQLGNLIRIDLLSITSDTIPIKPIDVTIVIDRGANTLAAWSDTTRQYRVQPFIPRAVPSATPKPGGTPRPGQSGTSPFSKLDVFAVTIKLTGHTTTAGTPTTGLGFDLQVQKKGEQIASHVTATAQLADEFPVFPMTLDVSIEPGALPFRARAAYAVDDLARVAPALARFTIPAGYAEAPSFAAVVFPRGTSRAPATPPPAHR